MDIIYGIENEDHDFELLIECDDVTFVPRVGDIVAFNIAPGPSLFAVEKVMFFPADESFRIYLRPTTI